MALPSLTLRNTKGSALTFSEMDTNLTNLQQANVTVTAGGTTTNIALNSGITLTAGNNITITNSLGNIVINSTASGGGGSSYGDANVAAYLPTYNGTIGSLTTANTIMKSYVDGQVTAANAGVTSANLGLKGYVDGQITTVNSSISAANLGMKGYVDSVAGGGSSYGNANVAAYLPTYSGNIANIRLGTDGVLTFADGTTQITAGGGGSYSNVQVATYLPTHAGSITVGGNTQSTSATTGALVVTGGVGVTGNIRTLGNLLIGDRITTTNLNNVWIAGSGSAPTADRSINIVGQNAGIKMNRENAFGPVIELNRWNTGFTSLMSSWRVETDSGNLFVISDFSGSNGSSRTNRFTISKATGQATTTILSDLTVSGNVTLNGNIFLGSSSGGNITPNFSLNGNVQSSGTAGPMNAGRGNLLVGYRGMPQRMITANVNTVASDMGCHFFANSAVTSDIWINLINDLGNNGDYYPVGTVMTVVNHGSANIFIISANSGSTYLAGTSNIDTRRVAPYGLATVLKVGDGGTGYQQRWIVSGAGVT